MPIFVLPFPVIDPVAVNIGPVPLRWYALAYIGGFIFGWLGLRALVANDALWRRGQPRPSRESLDDLLVFVAFGVIIGGRLGHVLIYDPGFYLAHPLEIFQTWKGGMAFHGGLVGAIIGMVALRASQRRAAAHRQRHLRGGRADRHFSSAASPISSSRRCGGARPTFPGRWFFPARATCRAIRASFMRRDSKACALGLLLWLAARHGALEHPGLVTGLFGVGYGLARIFCEFFREPDPVQEALPHGLTMGMVLSTPLVLDWRRARSCSRCARRSATA